MERIFMRKLMQFLNFDAEGFLEDKQVVFKGVREWREYKEDGTGDLLGTKVDLLIMADDTFYENSEEQELNAGETLSIKTTQPMSYFEDCKKMATPMKITNITKANVYGNYNNNLSIEADVWKPKAQQDN